MYLRDSLGMVVLFGFSIFFVSHGVPMTWPMSEKMPAASPLYDRITAGWNTSEASCQRRDPRHLGALLIVPTRS